MICGECVNKPSAKGVKYIKCRECGLETMTNVKYTDVCLNCSNKNNICQSCGTEFAKQIEYVDITKQGE